VTPAPVSLEAQRLERNKGKIAGNKEWLGVSDRCKTKTADCRPGDTEDCRPRENADF